MHRGNPLLERLCMCYCCIECKWDTQEQETWVMCYSKWGWHPPVYEVTVMMLKQLVETLLWIFQLVTCKATDLVELSSLLHNKGTLCKAYSVWEFEYPCWKTELPILGDLGGPVLGIHSKHRLNYQLLLSPDCVIQEPYPVPQSATGLRD